MGLGIASGFPLPLEGRGWGWGYRMPNKRARGLRNNATEAERRLGLRLAQVGCHFFGEPEGSGPGIHQHPAEPGPEKRGQ